MTAATNTSDRIRSLVLEREELLVELCKLELSQPVAVTNRRLQEVERELDKLPWKEVLAAQEELEKELVTAKELATADAMMDSIMESLEFTFVMNEPCPEDVAARQERLRATQRIAKARYSKAHPDFIRARTAVRRARQYGI